MKKRFLFLLLAALFVVAPGAWALKISDYPTVPGLLPTDEFVINQGNTTFKALYSQILSGAGSGDFSIPPKTVLIDPALPVITGKRYQTIAAGIAYAVTQTPSASNRWGVIFGGRNTEILTIPSWVNVVGITETATLAGAIDSGGAVASLTHEFAVANCVVENLALTGANGLMLHNCQVTGGTPAGGLPIFLNSETAPGLDLSAAIGVYSGGSLLNGGTFPGGSAIGGSVFLNDTLSMGESTTFRGGQFLNCNLFGPGAALVFDATAGESFHFINCNGMAGAAVTIDQDIAFNVYGGSWAQAITINSAGAVVTIQGATTPGAGPVAITLDAGTLTTRSIADTFTVTVNAGTYDNQGDFLDDSALSIAPAADVQTAIEKLDAAGGTFYTNILSVVPGTEIAGHKYQTIANAVAYLNGLTGGGDPNAPSASNHWVIQFAGVNAEVFTLPNYTTLEGIGNSIDTPEVYGSAMLTGAFDVAGAYTYLKNVTITDLTGLTGPKLELSRCNFSGVTVPSGVEIRSFRSTILNSDISGCGRSSWFYDSLFAGGTVGSQVYGGLAQATFQRCRFVDSGAATITNGLFQNCQINSGPWTPSFANGPVFLNNTLIAGESISISTWTVPEGATLAAATAEFSRTNITVNGSNTGAGGLFGSGNCQFYESTITTAAGTANNGKWNSSNDSVDPLTCTFTINGDLVTQGHFSKFSLDRGLTTTPDGEAALKWIFDYLLIPINGSRALEVTDSYLKNGEVFTNTTPYLTGGTVDLVAMEAATNGAETWAAELHVDGAILPSASISIVAADYGFVGFSPPLTIPAGSKISLYVNGTAINEPRITAYVRPQ
jgi:hypothetical protein